MPETEAFLTKVVNINSGSLNKEGVRTVGNLMGDELKKLGFKTEWITLPDSLNRAGHLVATRQGKKGKKLFLIGHLDTVFEKSLPMNPFTHVELTTNAISDADMVKPLVADITCPIARLSGDGAYDQVKVYDALETRRIKPVIPPRSNAVIWTDEAGNELVHARNEALTKMASVGLAEWNRIAEATSE